MYASTTDLLFRITPISPLYLSVAVRLLDVDEPLIALYRNSTCIRSSFVDLKLHVYTYKADEFAYYICFRFVFN